MRNDDTVYVPKWKEQMLARPMRKVVGRRELERPAGRPDYHPSIVELTLDCGHVVEELKLMLGSATAHRRRCRECARVTQQASVSWLQRLWRWQL